MKLIFRVLVLAAFAGSVAAQTPQYDVLIRNGKVVDGSGNPWIYADVGVIGDRIAFIGKAGEAVKAKQTIDASGLIVAPGFIDMLGQSELKLLIDKQAVSKITQGITTEITGEGDSVAPQNDRTIAEMKDFLTHYKLTVDWRSLDEYFRRVEKQGSAINIGTYVGAAQVRNIVIGQANRPPTAAELRQMQELVEDAMFEGAMGISSSLIYAPGSFASTEELIELSKVAAKHGGIYATHMRNEGDTQMQALEETFRIGREAGIPVEIFHLKMSGKQNWGRMKEVVEAIEKARTSGVDVVADQYPYIASQTSLGAAIPAKYHEGGVDAFIARLKDPAQRAAIYKELESPPAGTTENMWRGTGGPQGILVVGVLNPELKKYEGKNIAQIAQMQNKDPFDALAELIIADHDNVSAVYFAMNEDDVKLAMRQPWVSINTDVGAVNPVGPLGEQKVHPRAYGTFPRILGKYVREEGVLKLEEAIRKFTSLPAQRMKLHNRGQLRPDYFADITIFNPQTVRDVATFEDPNRTSQGIEYVLVNGVVEIDKGRITGELAGRPLRGPGYLGRDVSPDGQPVRGQMQGVVTDQQGWPMPRTKVSLLDKSGKELSSATTRRDGRYEIPADSACMECTIKAERAGFTSAQRSVNYNGANSLWFSFALARQR